MSKMNKLIYKMSNVSHSYWPLTKCKMYGNKFIVQVKFDLKLLFFSFYFNTSLSKMLWGAIKNIITETLSTENQAISDEQEVISWQGKSGTFQTATQMSTQ